VVKLADFGVGRSLDMLPHGAAKTRLVGTPLYFSPEMCEVPPAPPAGSPSLPSGRTLRRRRAARRPVAARACEWFDVRRTSRTAFPTTCGASVRPRCTRAAVFVPQRSEGAAHGLGHAR